MLGDRPLSLSGPCLASGDSPLLPLGCEGVLRFCGGGSGLPDTDLESRLILFAGEVLLSLGEGDGDLFLLLTSGLGDRDIDLSLGAFFLLLPDFP